MGFLQDLWDPGDWGSSVTDVVEDIIPSIKDVIADIPSSINDVIADIPSSIEDVALDTRDICRFHFESQDISVFKTPN